MTGKSLYDVLEVNSNASPESIRAAYERLSANVPANSTSPDEKLRAMAIAHAFITLANPAKRAQYDKTLTVGSQQPTAYNVQVIEPFWTLPKLIALSIAVILCGAQYYKYKKQETRLETEKAVATARLSVIERNAGAPIGQSQFELAKQQAETIQEERVKRDAAAPQFNSEQQMIPTQTDGMQQNRVTR